MVGQQHEDMKVLRVFNNNVVLAHRTGSDEEVILTGRGLGFQARPGDPVDMNKVIRTFVPSQGRDPDHVAQMLAGIPPEIIQIVSDSLAPAGLQQMAQDSPSLVVALADHTEGAIQRQERGINVEYPLQGEVENLYPGEYAQGKAFIDALNKQLDNPIPAQEAVAIALHLVSSGFANGDLTYTYQMTGVIEQVLAIIEESFVDRKSVV